jgi:hypothetical protein
MKYAQVINGKVVATQSGAEPTGSGWVAVQKQWSIPTDYPGNFYSPTSNIPRLTVVGDEVHETWGFALKPLEAIKSELYQSQKEDRKKAQLGSFMLGDVEITLKDREDSLIIASLTAKDMKFKLGQGQWVQMSGVEVQALKDAHELHVQAAYDAEEASNLEVDMLDTIDKLNEYLNDSG